VRSGSSPDGQSFLEAARRAQIVACAIETLAADGYSRASLARIAQRAGVSKSVIVYHFGGKDQVFQAVVFEVFRAATEAVRPRIEAEPTAAGKLRAYLESRVEFLATHRQHMLALFEIWINLRAEDGQPQFTEADAKPTLEAIETILRDGQQSGEFARFSVPVMAMAIRQAVDGVLLQLRVRPDLDLKTWARELTELFDRATRRQS
jgi:TetR/AcrR family transcriptional regulator, fatty acid metabolism regulator protein